MMRREKERALRDALSSLGSVVVAYSGGVDSAYLACVATGRSATAPWPSPPTARAIPSATASWRSRSRASSACATRSSRPNELERPSTARTPPTAATTASTSSTRTCRGSPSERHAVVVDGNNADDRGDYRPGRQAAREFGVRSPLDEVDLTKDEIRELSRRAGLPTWDEPASACLSSRIPYHTRSDRREAADDRARRGGAARARLPRLPRAAPRRPGAHRDRPRRDAARARARDRAPRSSASSRRSATATSRLDLQGYRTGSLNEGLLLRPA